MMKTTKFLSLAASALMAVALVSCHNGDEPPYSAINDVHLSSYGVFVLNEGSYFSQINGTLSLVSPTEEATKDSLFIKANGRALGGTPNHAVITNKEMYIATTEENRVEVINNDLRSVAVVKVKQPRELATDGAYVYVSSFAGKVYKIDVKSHTAIDSTAVIGANLEGIAVRNGSVYVCNSWNADYTYNNNVVKLDAKTLDKQADITVVSNPTKLLNTSDGLYLISSGNYNDIQPSLQHIADDGKVTQLGNYTMMAEGDGKLYVVNAPYGAKATYATYDFATKKFSPLNIGTEVYSPYDIAYDKSTKLIYLTSLSEDKAKHAASYTTAGYMAVYGADGKYLVSCRVGVNPGTIITTH